MLKFNDYLKEAKLSAKQKKIAAIAGDKDKIDAADLAALRAGKKPVDECDYGKMKKEELVGNQYKLDKNKNGKLDAQDFKMLRKEEVEELEEGKMKELSMDLTDMGHDEFHKKYGNPKSHFDSTNFKKPVEPGKGMDRAKALAQRGMKSLSKEEVERLEEKLTQLDELSKATLTSYANKASDSYADHKAKEKKAMSNYEKTASGEKSPSYDKHGRDEYEQGEHHADNAAKRKAGVDKAYSKLAKEERDYVSATLKVMDEGKIDNLRDAQKLRQDTQSAYDKNYKPDTSHPHIQVVKGSAYGGMNQKDDEGDEKPDDESKEKRGRGRPSGSKSGARLKGGGHEDGGIPVHNLHLPKSYK